MQLSSDATIDEAARAYVLALLRAGYTTCSRNLRFRTPTGQIITFELKFGPADQRTVVINQMIQNTMEAARKSK
jgi:hypothetical protein